MVTTMSSAAAYLSLHASGELARRTALALARLEACDLCGHRCGVDRRTERGRCHTGVTAVVASLGPHFGEEAVLVGRGGSGTIFFSWCNLNCVFCQNFELSQRGEGREVTPAQLAAAMLELQAMGCQNINLVSPSHVVPVILAALDEAAGFGLSLPIVYNTGGFDALSTLELLDGVVDIYMPDMKVADPGVAARLCGAPDYPEVNRAAVREMHRQVGDLVTDARGVAVRGLLVRHLVLPHRLAGTAATASFLADEVSPDTFVNVMAQYRPCFRASEFPDLDRPPTRAEYREAVAEARGAGLVRLEVAEPWHLP